MSAWSDQQQRVLRAMGYAVYARVTPSLPTAITPTTEMATTDCATLLRALQLAAMRRDVSPWIADPVALRGDARAKRALWPSLRALRRAQSSASSDSDNAI